MRKIFTGTAECGGEPISYYLLVEQTAETGAEVYGAAVEYRDETVELPSVTLSRPRAMSLLERLRRGGVTPVAAPDVTADWQME